MERCLCASKTMWCGEYNDTNLEEEMKKLWYLALAAILGLLAAGSAFAEERVVTVAHDCTWPPMEFVNEKQELVGYSFDYMDAVAKEAGFKVEHKNVQWDGIFAGLANGQYDVIASSVTVTPERKRQFDFSEPYYEVLQAVALPIDSTATSLDQLKGKTFGAQIGTTGKFALDKHPDVIAKSYDEVGLAFEDLINGRIDGVVCDDPVATQFALLNKDYAKKIKIGFIIPAEQVEEYAFAVNKGNQELVDLLNKGIRAVKEKGIDAQLKAKWFKSAQD